MAHMFILERIKEKKKRHSIIFSSLFVHLFILLWIMQKAIFTLASIVTFYIIVCNKTRSFALNE